MGAYDILPSGSQVKCWECLWEDKKVRDVVPDILPGISNYIVLLREGGFIRIENSAIAEICEDGLLRCPEQFIPIPCFDKWGGRMSSKEELLESYRVGEELLGSY